MATAATDVTQDDPIETLYERGVTDGLPVVPPTRQRVERMLAGAPTLRGNALQSFSSQARPHLVNT